MPLTPSQELAASVRGRALLISAAAGSGKTRVLVERLMRYVDDGADIDEFLVITYTRAAASELRGRILRELNERMAGEPGNRRLRRQTELCQRAAIGTIDSICGRILRDYVHLTALTPDFRVMEEERAEAMKRSALDRVLEQRYARMDEDGEFRALVDSVGAGRDDGKLVELVLSLYDSLRAHPHPEQWMEQCAASLDFSHVKDAGETAWGEYLLRRAGTRAAYWAGRLEEALTMMDGDGAVSAAYAEGFAAAAEGLREVARASRLGWDRTASCLPVGMKIKSCRAKSECKERCKAVWDECRRACDKLAEEFAMASGPLLEDMERTAPALRALLSLTAALDTAYAGDKRRAGLVDFSDQEHMVLSLLERQENGVAAELSAQWREVMVDEYQDVNDCQDRLFTLLSGGGERLFLVGDVKQSIYRFRLANPGIFLDKYQRFAPVERAGAGEGGRILLRENFRSSQAVIRGTNYVFSSLLSRELGEMEYDEDAMLTHGRSEVEGYAPPAVELTIYDMPEQQEEGGRQNRTALEAAAVAGRIRAMVEAGTPIPDGSGGMRPLRYGDVAILLRSYKAASPHFRRALDALGIPCTASQGGGFFRSLEITVLLSFLSIIDNPRQDIPLIAVLRSPLFAFTPDELAAIRERDRDGDFYTALTAMARDDERALHFLDTLGYYRALAPELPISALLEELCVRENIPALLAAMPDAPARQRNLTLLRDYAVQFEQGGDGGLFRFVAWMKRLAANGEEPFAGGEGGGDAVQLMSIHRSKGLEFPVVFLSDTAHRFNLSDSQEAVLVHPRLGIASKVTDALRGVEYPTLSWRAIADCLRTESLSEELRVLYVAMTRARERLYITAVFPDGEKAMARLAEGLTLPVAPLLLESDRCMAQWLCRCALGGSEALTLRRERLGEGQQTAEGGGEEGGEAGTERVLHIREKLDWRYPWAASESLPSKLTASHGRAGELPDGDAAIQGAAEERIWRQVRLDEENRTLSGAERGTAVHLALQFIDYERCVDRPGVMEELQRLRRLGHLSEEQMRAVDPAVLLRFFRSELGQRILCADRVYREQRFTLLLSAENFGGSAEDDILFQGVVDCVIEEEGELTVIDYKTDFVTPETLPARAESYAAQVRAYAEAMSRIRKMPVREGVLYFLRAGRAVNVEI